MLQQPIIETTGSITKVEMLSTIEQSILPGSLVLRNVKPFPGYTEPLGEKRSAIIPQSYYLITMYRYYPEKLERISLSLKKENLIECCSSFGEIVIQNKILPCIRIKRLNSESQIIDIQNFYKRNDIKFMPHRNILAEGKVKVFKHFKVVEIAEGIYRDLSEGEKFYITIPVQLNWKLFEHIVLRIKSKILNSNFDPAIGIINRFSGPEDVIRIFDKIKTLERALEIKKFFIREIKKERLLLTSFEGTNREVFY